MDEALAMVGASINRAFEAQRPAGLSPLMFRLYCLLLSQIEPQKLPLRLSSHKGKGSVDDDIVWFCLKNSVFRYLRYQNNIKYKPFY